MGGKGSAPFPPFSMFEPKIYNRDLPKILKKFYKQQPNRNFPNNADHALIDLIEWTIRIPSKSRRNVYKSSELNKKLLLLLK